MNPLRRLLGWLNAPLYGALFAWVVPWARRLLLWSAGCVGLGLVAGAAARRLAR